MSDWLRFGLCTLLCSFGVVVIATSIFGVFRFRFVLNRMHCAAIIDTLGALFLLGGLMLAADAPVYAWKLFAILLVLWIGSPIASHLVSRMELLTDPDALNHVEQDVPPEDADGIL